MSSHSRASFSGSSPLYLRTTICSGLHADSAPGRMISLAFASISWALGPGRAESGKKTAASHTHPSVPSTRTAPSPLPETMLLHMHEARAVIFLKSSVMLVKRSTPVRGSGSDVAVILLGGSRALSGCSWSAKRPYKACTLAEASEWVQWACSVPIGYCTAQCQAAPNRPGQG